MIGILPNLPINTVISISTVTLFSQAKFGLLTPAAIASKLAAIASKLQELLASPDPLKDFIEWGGVFGVFFFLTACFALVAVVYWAIERLIRPMKLPGRHAIAFIIVVLALSIFVWAANSFLGILDRTPVDAASDFSSTRIAFFEVFVAALSFAIAAATLILSYVTFASELRQKIEETNDKLVPEIMRNRSLLQKAVIAKFKEASFDYGGPILWIDSPKTLFDLGALTKSRVSLSSPIPRSNASDGAAYGRSPTDDASDSPSPISSRFGIKLKNNPAFIIAESPGHARLSEGGSIRIRLGDYFEGYQNCEIPLWKIAEKIVLDDLDYSPYTIIRNRKNSSLRHALRQSLSLNRTLPTSGERTKRLKDLFLEKFVARPNSPSGERAQSSDQNTPSRYETIVEWKNYLSGKHETATGSTNNSQFISGIGVATLTVAVMKVGPPQFLLLRRRSDGSVSEFIGLTSVVPSGGLSPTYFDLGDCAVDNDLVTENIIREYFEELILDDPHDQYEKLISPIDTRDDDNLGFGDKYEAVADKFNAYLADGKIVLKYLGLGIDILSGRPNFLTLLILSPDAIADRTMGVAKWRRTFEGHVEPRRFEQPILSDLCQNFEKEKLSPAGFGCFDRAVAYFPEISSIISQLIEDKTKKQPSLAKLAAKLPLWTQIGKRGDENWLGTDFVTESWFRREIRKRNSQAS